MTWHASWYLTIAMLPGILVSCEKKPEPISIIFDTDIAPDYDDVGALAMLHAFANSGEAEILATISCNAFTTTAPTLSVINTYFNRAEILIGIVKDSVPHYKCDRLWAESIIEKYPHNLKSNNDAEDAVQLYRKILASRPDTSVTIVTVGFFTNLADLLMSQPDQHSPLDGPALVHRKVKNLVSMAGAIDSTGNGGFEFNVMADIPASQKVFSDWPTPITLSGLEIGYKIFTGMKLIADSTIQNSPVKDAYDISITYDGTKEGRYSWDQTAVLVAVRGVEPYFNFRKLNLTIENDGRDSVIAGTRITYLLEKKDPQEIAMILESLMTSQPTKQGTK